MATMQSASRGLKSSHTVLHVGNGGVGLDLAVHAVSKVCSHSRSVTFLVTPELDQIRVRADERFLVATGSQLGHNVLDGTVAHGKKSYSGQCDQP